MGLGGRGIGAGHRPHGSRPIRRSPTKASCHDGGSPANGSYNLDFSLWDAASGGSQIGSTESFAGHPVSDGVFTVQLDFGASAFDNSDRWLGIEVDGTPLGTRQPITRTPYSIQTRGIFVDDSLKVGIGTTSPAFPLHTRHAQPYIQFDDTGGGSSWLVGLQSPTVGFNIQEVGAGTRLVISEGGNVGIGTTSPQYALHVEEAVFNTTLYSENSRQGGTAVIGWATDTTPGWTGYGVLGRSDGEIGNGVYGYARAISGVNNKGVRGRCDSPNGYDFYAGGSGIDYGTNSSRRWKRNIRNIDEPLYKLSKLRGVYYDWDEEHGGHHDVGMIAEEVGAVLPEIVNYEDNGIDANGMDYSKLTPLLVEAVNELRYEKDGEILRLQHRISELENLVGQLVSK